MPKRRIARIASFKIAPERQMVIWTVNNATVGSATFQIGRMPKGGHLREATYTQGAAAAGTTYTVQLRTGAVNLTQTLSITGLGAGGSANFTVNDPSDFKAGDVLTAVFTATGATVAPGNVTICLVFGLTE